MRTGGTIKEYYVDGGFVQVTRDSVYILTDRMLDPKSLDPKTSSGRDAESNDDARYDAGAIGVAGTSSGSGSSQVQTRLLIAIQEIVVMQQAEGA